MTIGAFLAETALVVRIGVAGSARSLRILEPRCSMALLAGHRDVQAEEGKTRQIVVEADRFSPAALVVALTAAGSELPLVRIVLPVTGDACRRQLVLVEVAGVASGAFLPRMCTLQREFRRLGMIKFYIGPFHRRVARVAFCTIAPAMGILDAVAGNT